MFIIFQTIASYILSVSWFVIGRRTSLYYSLAENEIKIFFKISGQQNDLKNNKT